MRLHHVAVADCPPQPWRNGGGLTRELLAWPQADAWALRVSVARIDRDGPFSPFPGVRRCFAVLHGAGVELDLPQGRRSLGPADVALAFDGEDAPGCRLLEGPTEDLNLMARREAGVPALWRAAAGDTLAGTTRWRGLFALHDAQLDIADRTEAVAAGTLAWCDDDATAPWALRRGSGWWLTLAEG